MLEIIIIFHLLFTVYVYTTVTAIVIGMFFESNVTTTANRYQEIVENVNVTFRKDYSLESYVGGKTVGQVICNILLCITPIVNFIIIGIFMYTLYLAYIKPILQTRL